MKGDEQARYVNTEILNQQKQSATTRQRQMQEKGGRQRQQHDEQLIDGGELIGPVHPPGIVDGADQIAIRDAQTRQIEGCRAEEEKASRLYSRKAGRLCLRPPV